MQIDWNVLGHWDIVFGILGGIVFVFTAARWILNRMKSHRFVNLLAWVITGDEDEKAFLSTLKKTARIIVAAVIWALIGGLVGSIATGITILLGTAASNQTTGNGLTLLPYIVLGAIVGVVFRILILPIVETLRRSLRARQQSHEARHAAFEAQKRRVESKIRRTEDHE